MIAAFLTVSALAYGLTLCALSGAGEATEKD